MQLSTQSFGAMFGCFSVLAMEAVMPGEE